MFLGGKHVRRRARSSPRRCLKSSVRTLARTCAHTCSNGDLGGSSRRCFLCGRSPAASSAAPWSSFASSRSGRSARPHTTQQTCAPHTAKQASQAQQAQQQTGRAGRAFPSFLSDLLLDLLFLLLGRVRRRCCCLRFLWCCRCRGRSALADKVEHRSSLHAVRPSVAPKSRGSAIASCSRGFAVCLGVLVSVRMVVPASMLHIGA